MNLFTVYLLTVLPNLGAWFSGLTWALATALVVLLILFIFCAAAGAGYSEEDEDNKRAQATIPWLKRVALAALVSGFLGAAIPSEKQMAIIVAGNYLTNSEWSKLPDDVAQLLRKQLKSWTDQAEKRGN